MKHCIIPESKDMIVKGGKSLSQEVFYSTEGRLLPSLERKGHNFKKLPPFVGGLLQIISYRELCDDCLVMVDWPSTVAAATQSLLRRAHFVPIQSSHFCCHGLFLTALQKQPGSP